MADSVSNKGAVGGGRRVGPVIMSVVAMVALVAWVTRVVDVPILGYTGVHLIAGE